MEMRFTEASVGGLLCERNSQKKKESYPTKFKVEPSVSCVISELKEIVGSVYRGGDHPRGLMGSGAILGCVQCLQIKPHCLFVQTKKTGGTEKITT